MNRPPAGNFHGGVDWKLKSNLEWPELSALKLSLKMSLKKVGRFRVKDLSSYKKER